MLHNEISASLIRSVIIALKQHFLVSVHGNLTHLFHRYFLKSISLSNPFLSKEVTLDLGFLYFYFFDESVIEHVIFFCSFYCI